VKAQLGADSRELPRLFDTTFGSPAGTTGTLMASAQPVPVPTILERAAPSLVELMAAVGTGNADPYTYTYSQLSQALTRAGRTHQALDAARKAEQMRNERRAGSRI